MQDASNLADVPYISTDVSSAVGVSNYVGSDGGVYVTSSTVPTDRSGVISRDTSLTVDNNGNVINANGDTTNLSNGVAVGLIPQQINGPKTFAELILNTLPTQARQYSAPQTATVSTYPMPAQQSSGGNTILFLVLGVLAIAATMYYAKHKTL